MVSGPGKRRANNMRTRFYQKITSLLLVLFMCCFAGFIVSVTNTNSKVNADQSQVFELAGAEVRSETPAGIRFVTNVSDSFYDAHGSDVFGTLVIPTNLLGENEDLSLETENAQNIVTQNWKVKPGSGDTYQYTSTLIGKDMTSQLPIKEWNRKLTAISYVWDGENLSSVVYSNAEERSLAEVAAGVLASGEIDTDEEGFLRTICDTVIGENALAFSEGTEITKKDLEEQVTLTLAGNQGLKAVYTSNSADITVDENGVVSATAYGTATITATIGTKTAEIEVTYVEPVATSLSFNQDSIELYSHVTIYGTYESYFTKVSGTDDQIYNNVNDSIPIADVLTVRDQYDDVIDLSELDITFSSTESRTAKVEDGEIFANSVQYARSATITASLNDMSDTLTVYVRGSISSKADLDILAYAPTVSGFGVLLTDTSRYYVLTNDIDYQDQDLLPIAAHPHNDNQSAWGNYGAFNPGLSTPFATTLDGKGHVIKNAYIPSTVMISTQNVNTFGSFIGDLTGTLKNIGFVNLRTKLIAEETGFTGTNQDYQISSGLVCRNRGVMENIYLDMKIYKQSYTSADYISGALAARTHDGSTTRNCIVVSEKDYTNSNHNSGTAKDWGAAFGIVLNGSTVSNVLAVSQSLTRCVAYSGSGAPLGDALNAAGVLYTSVSAMITAKSAEIGAFGGYWTLNGTELKFGNTVIS